MAYEIPQNLRYEEKIVFGLSLKQLFWLFLFGGLAAVIFFKTALVFELKIVLALSLALLGTGFAFFNWFSFVKDAFAFFSSPKKIGYLDARMSEFIEVRGIEGDAVVLKDGSLRALVQVQPVNFSMLSVPEQKAVSSAYADLLNSLDFSFQIVMRTVNLDLNDYFNSLEQSVRQKNDLKLLDGFNDFKGFVEEFVEGNAVKNRLFYVVVPVDSAGNSFQGFFKAKDLRQRAFSQLDIRVKLCREKLNRCGLFTKRLSGEELVSLFSSFFEEFIEVENNYFYPISLAERIESAEKAENLIEPEGRVVTSVVGV